MSDSDKPVSSANSFLIARLHHVLVLLTDLETVRDFMLDPDYTHEKAVGDAVDEVKMIIDDLENPEREREWKLIPDRPDFC